MSDDVRTTTATIYDFPVFGDPIITAALKVYQGLPSGFDEDVPPATVLLGGIDCAGAIARRHPFGSEVRTMATGAAAVFVLALKARGPLVPRRDDPDFRLVLSSLLLALTVWLEAGADCWHAVFGQFEFDGLARAVDSAHGEEAYRMVTAPSLLAALYRGGGSDDPGLLRSITRAA